MPPDTSGQSITEMPLLPDRLRPGLRVGAAYSAPRTGRDFQNPICNVHNERRQGRGGKGGDRKVMEIDLSPPPEKF